jgi:hypothetical protein
LGRKSSFEANIACLERVMSCCKSSTYVPEFQLTHIIDRASTDVNGKPVSNLEKVHIILIPLTTPGYNVLKSIPTKIKYVLLITIEIKLQAIIFDLIWWRQLGD